MLNDKIIRCSFIGDIYGLKFFLSAIYSGVKSRTSLVNLYLHNSKRANVNIDIALLLLSEMGIIDFDGSKIYFSISEELRNIETIDSLIEWFSVRLYDFVITNEILDTSHIKYNSVEDRYILPFNAFHRKYAIFRNLFLTLSIIQKRSDGNFYIDSSLIPNLKTICKAKKMSQNALLKILEAQREQGDKGEDFAVAFEQKRLSSHPLIDRISRISILDVSAGYDIVSFNSLGSSVFDRFIEVKTFVGTPHFHWSNNEIEVAKLLGDKYYIYLVDYNQIHNSDYQPLIICNPSSYLDGNNEWLTKPDSYLIEYVGS